MKNLEERIQKIEKRNKVVEIDKAWEISLFRKLVIFVFTYLILGVYMYIIEVDKPWLNAVVPSLGFFLSTLSMPFFRKVWERLKNKGL